ncbi:MAG: hypothetical protein ACK5MR_10140 [Cumulibacter sp.]
MEIKILTIFMPNAGREEGTLEFSNVDNFEESGITTDAGYISFNYLSKSTGVYKHAVFRTKNIAGYSLGIKNEEK